MGGHGGGLAGLIFIAATLMVATPFVIGVLIGRRVGGSAAKRWSIALGVGLLGAGAGVLAVTATFFESVWQPPPLRVKLNPPSSYAHGWIVVLEDPTVSNELQWSGVRLPFITKTVAIKVPPSGIVRVRDLGNLGAEPMDIGGGGGGGGGRAGGPAPPGVNATIYLALCLRACSDPTSSENEPPFGDGPAMARYILQRERIVK